MQNISQWRRNGLNRVTSGLFLSLVILEVLDLHSTWLGIQGRGESNVLVNSLIDVTGNVLTGLLITKSMSFLLIGLMFSAWSKAPSAHAARVVVCALLVVMDVVLGLVVINNYVS